MAFERELAQPHELDGVRPAAQLARLVWTDMAHFGQPHSESILKR